MAVAQKAEAGAKPTLTVFSGAAGDLDLDPWPTASGAIDQFGKVLFRDPLKRYSVGVYQCGPSKFIAHYPGTESGHVLAGRARHWSLKRRQRDSTLVLHRPVEAAGVKRTSSQASR